LRARSSCLFGGGHGGRCSASTKPSHSHIFIIGSCRCQSSSAASCCHACNELRLLGCTCPGDLELATGRSSICSFAPQHTRRDRWQRRWRSQLGRAAWCSALPSAPAAGPCAGRWPSRRAPAAAAR
jgi:hypothetical protein